MKYPELFEEQLNKVYSVMEDGVVYYCLAHLAKQIRNASCLNSCLDKTVGKGVIHWFSSPYNGGSKAKYLTKEDIYTVWKYRMDMDNEAAGLGGNKNTSEPSFYCEPVVLKSEDVVSFTHSKFRVIHIVEIDNEYWFLAGDLAKILMCPESVIDDIRNFDSKDVRPAVWSGYWDDKPENLVNIFGLYTLIYTSKLPPEWKTMFKRWVMDDILASLRNKETASVDSSMIDVFNKALAAWMKIQTEGYEIIRSVLTECQALDSDFINNCLFEHDLCMDNLPESENI